MTGPTYSELIHELLPGLPGGVRWGLDRTRRILAAADNPHRRFATVHVGGTNGKGSVAATLASVLREAGHRTGLYTSPHLLTYRERIQVDGVPVDEAAVATAAARVWPAVREERASPFEAGTAVAFEALSQARVDVAVVEVGLGGRLDATNVIDPDLVVITNVALDHAEFLGDTVEEVAAEKAGIIKPGVPVVTAETAPAARAILEDRAREVRAPIRTFDPASPREVRVARDGTRFRLPTERWGTLELHTPLIGEHQAVNAALAVRGAEVAAREPRPDAGAVERGVARVALPGRFQVESVGRQTWVLDAAHNPEGARAMATTLRRVSMPRPIVAVAGILSDKDSRGMLAPLTSLVDATILTVPPGAPPGRRWDPRAAAARLSADSVDAIEDFDEAIRRARRRAGAGTVVVTGSFHTVAAALLLLGRAPFGADRPLPPAASPA